MIRAHYQLLKNQFRPEYLNRIDEIINFRPLSREDLQEIIKLQLIELTNLLAEQDLELRIDNSIIETLAFEGYEPEYGARPVKRSIRYLLETPLSNKILSGEVQSGDLVIISSGEIGGLVFNIKN